MPLLGPDGKPIQSEPVVRSAVGAGDEPYDMDFGGANVRAWLKEHLTDEEWDEYERTAALWVQRRLAVGRRLWWLPARLAWKLTGLAGRGHRRRLDDWQLEAEVRAGAPIPKADPPMWKIKTEEGR